MISIIKNSQLGFNQKSICHNPSITKLFFRSIKLTEPVNLGNFIFPKKPLNKISVKFMKKVAKETVSKVAVGNAPKNVYPKQGMAGKFSCGDFNKNCIKPDGSPEEPFLLKHRVIMDNTKKTVVAVATSSKKVMAHKVSKEKIDGSFTSKDAANIKPTTVTDYGYEVTLKKKPKREMMDDYGYTIPSDIKGGQLIGMLETPVVPDPGVFIEDPKGTEWCDKHETVLEEITKLQEYQGLTSRSSKLNKDA